MPLLPTQNSATDEFEETALSVLTLLKKGGVKERNDFVWVHQERVYAVAYLGTGDPDHAEEVTLATFSNAFNSLNQNLPKNPDLTVWDWLSQFVVDAMAEYHNQNSGPPDDEDSDPAQDGSASMDWETTVLLGVQRVKRCINSLPQDLKRVFILRHNLDLNYEQISIVSNQTIEKCMAQLYRARVQVVKCLGRG
ncbi:MAG: sigma-70 family RNA polymerase sigma factor [Candidatus Obscuribacterales bacterium]|nr:sigma-70 family RNA polymerase sigma factor [Candidatus Obscuribacterales bacterium]